MIKLKLKLLFMKIVLRFHNYREAYRKKKALLKREDELLSHVLYLIDLMPPDQQENHCSTMGVSRARFNNIMTSNRMTESEAKMILNSIKIPEETIEGLIERGIVSAID